MIRGEKTMGRQIQINATAKDIALLIGEVNKDYGKLIRLDHRANRIDLPYDQLAINSTYHLTTEYVYNQIKTAADTFDPLNPTTNHPHIMDFFCQCVEISPSMLIRSDHTIGGGLEPGGRIYAYSERIEPVNKLYECFLKHTRRIACKYKRKDRKGGYVIYSFPEADAAIKDYLLKEEMGIAHPYHFILPENFKSDFILE